ncbi:hypothetical protein RCL1_002781 [Eukaryota sp. TZLM3-RCL]
MLLSTNQQLITLLESKPALIFVGCSGSPEKAAFHVPQYMQSQGFKIVPINPKEDTILGEQVFRQLSDLSSDLLQSAVVVLFRPSKEVPIFLDQCLNLGVKTLWLQEGISHSEALDAASNNKIDLVENKCILKVHRALIA